MVKPAPLSPSKRKSPFRWWRAILGALLALLIAVPYTMGSDAKKYLRGWIDTVNQGNARFHLEIVNYQRHWFTSDGEILISSDSLPAPISLHFTAYHGPLFINVDRPLRLGLAYLKGSIDSSKILGQQKIVQADGPIQITAFLPYFNDRELRASFPPILINDKENKVNYQLQTMEGRLDGDDLLQLDFPSLIISRQDGKEIGNLQTSTLRIVPGSHLASLSAKQINIHADPDRPATINNLVIQTDMQALSPGSDKLKFMLNLHFDQIQLQLNPKLVPSPLTLGPFEFNLSLSGIQSQAFASFGQTLKTLSMQKDDLTPEEGETLEKSMSQIIAPDALFDLNSSLNTTKGKIDAQFQGGLKLPKTTTALQSFSDLSDAFYSKGSVNLAPPVKQALSDYAAELDTADENLGLPTLLGFFKQDAQGGFTSQIDVHDGKVILNGSPSFPLTPVIPAKAGIY